jgi:serine O-acetyltransferase
MLNNIRADLRRYPGSGFRRLAVAAISQGFWAVVSYRIGHALRAVPRPLRLIILVVWLPISKLVECLTGIQIGAGASIGPGLYIGHLGCIIVSGHAIIGEGCNLSQGVTIGVSGRPGRRGVPLIGDRVYVGPGAKVLGPISIGSRSAIGANAVVLKDVPPGVTVAGIPARIVSENGSDEFIEVAP